MKRRLTFLFGNTSMSTTLDSEEADHVLRCWRACLSDEPDAVQFATVAGSPVMHIALAGVHAITDEIA